MEAVFCKHCHSDIPTAQAISSAVQCPNCQRGLVKSAQSVWQETKALLAVKPSKTDKLVPPMSQAERTEKLKLQIRLAPPPDLSNNIMVGVLALSALTGFTFDALLDFRYFPWVFAISACIGAIPAFKFWQTDLRKSLEENHKKLTAAWRATYYCSECDSLFIYKDREYQPYQVQEKQLAQGAKILRLIAIGVVVMLAASVYSCSTSKPQATTKSPSSQASSISSTGAEEERRKKQERDRSRAERDALQPTLAQLCREGNMDACKQFKEWEDVRRY